MKPSAVRAASISSLLLAAAVSLAHAGGDAKAKRPVAGKVTKAKEPIKERFHFPWSHKKAEPTPMKKAWVPPKLETVSVGRTVRHGRLVEAHKETRVVADGHFNLALPAATPAETGPLEPQTPPQFVPPPESQRLSDAERDVEAAKRQLVEQAQRAKMSVDEANALGPEVARLSDENARLRAERDALQRQVDEALHAHGNSTNPYGGPPRPEASPVAATSDTLRAWGENALRGK
jgi:hypothetical protein